MNGNGLLLLQTLIGAVTVLLSIVGASFATGRGIGRMEGAIRAVETTTHTIIERLTRIEALFELRLKGHDGK